MKLSTIFILTLCQFSIDAGVLTHSEESMLKKCQDSDFQVSHVQIFEMMAQLAVTWVAPECGDAQMKYILEYSSSGQTVTVQTENTFYNFNYAVNPCFDDLLTITAVADGTLGKSLSTPVYDSLGLEGIGEVENISGRHSNNTVIVQWEPPKKFSDCDLNYRIALEVNNVLTTTEVYNELSVVITNAFLKPCENATLTITASRGTKTGPPLNKHIQGEIGPVTNVVTDNAFEGFVDYDEPENSELCNLRYEMFLGPTVCLERRISISAFDRFGDQRSTTALTVQQLPDPVVNLAVRRVEPAIVEMSWDAIERVDDCPSAYYISFEFNGIPRGYGFFTETVLPVYINQCQDVNGSAQAVFSVQVYVLNVMGIAAVSSPISVCGDDNETVLDP